MSTTVRELAELVQGQVEGDGDCVIDAARPLGEARPGDITFLENPRHTDQLFRSTASAAVVPPGVSARGMLLIQVADPLEAFVTIVRRLHGRPDPPTRGIDPRAWVHPSVTIGADVSIYPFVSIDEGTTIGARCRLYPGVSIGRFCRLGDDVVLHPNVVLYEDSVLGDRVILHSNTVIGADGFGYRLKDGRHVKVPQLGSVEIGADVEIGACTAVDRGTFQVTRIGAGTKIDNHVQVGHNCHIGKHNLFVAQVGIAGSSSTGDYVVVAGQVGITDHVHIGDRALIGARAGVTKNVPADQRMLGAPATAERDQKRIWMTLEKLPGIRRDLRRIKQQLGLKDEDQSAA